MPNEMNTVSAPTVSLSLFDYSQRKKCDIYDSRIQAEGQAYDIVVTNEINGWKELTFTLPHMISNKTNFRWQFIKNEYLLRLRVGDDEDWFIVQAPKKSKNSRSINETVKCPHVSSILKTKNLYLVFDDENGIGKINELMNKVLKGTGWTLGVCDTLYEKDGKTEKIRSITSDGKAGTYKLISDLCGLFNAYPIFHGDTKTIDIRALQDKLPQIELVVGKNLNALSVEYDSESIVTRLYVEGEYGDLGYVGIDEVNPTGLPFLLNFDYYKEIGLFTDEHQAILDTYLADIQANTAELKTVINNLSAKETELNNLWGQYNYMLYVLDNRTIARKIKGGTVETDKEEIHPDDELIVLKAEGPYRTVKVVGTENPFESDDLYALKYVVTKPNGKIGAQEVAIEAKQELIKNLQRKLEITFDEADRKNLEDQITELQKQIEEIYNGTPEAEGLYSLMRRAILLVISIDDMKLDRDRILAERDEIEAAFVNGMGDLLKDGYWSNKNYTVGQENFLYQDGLEMINQISKPAVEYTVSLVALSRLMGFREDKPQLNAKARIYDEELGVNDIVYITKITRYLDNPMKDQITISNEDIALTGKSFESVMGKITNLADLVDQKNSLYSRAEAINGNGTIEVNRLDGAIDILRNQLLSSTSSWYTDDSGNIIFESVNGKSAMMLCGEGFMIADGRTDEGGWNWTTAGTGQGLTADVIVAGFLSAERIRAGTISADKLSTNVGASIDLSENNTIKLLAQSVEENTITRSTTAPENPTDGMLWMDTSVEPYLLKSWDEAAGKWVSSGADLSEYYTKTELNTKFTQTDEKIEAKASKTEVGALNTRLTSAESKITPEAITTTVSGSIENAMNKAIETSSSEIKQTKDDLTIEFNSSMDSLGQQVEDVVQEQAKQNLWIRIDPVTGVEIGRQGDPAKFRTDNRSLEVPKIKTGTINLSQKMDSEEWAVIPGKSGLSIKWIGGEI